MPPTPHTRVGHVIGWGVQELETGLEQGWAHRKRTLRRTVLASLLVASLITLLGLSSLSTPLDTWLETTLYRVWNTLQGPVRVGIQVGHENAANHPDELESLRTSTGGRARGVEEVEVNRAVAERLAARLKGRGILVDLLPATLPRGYHADLLVALHADASPDPSRRGYKSAHFLPARNRLEPLLQEHLDTAYLQLSGLPSDETNVSRNMERYYAFNWRRFRHSAHPGTPAVIVEMGYLSNPQDAAFLSDPSRPADALFEGVTSYLRERGRLPEFETVSR